MQRQLGGGRADALDRGHADQLAVHDHAWLGYRVSVRVRLRHRLRVRVRVRASSRSETETTRASQPAD